MRKILIVIPYKKLYISVVTILIVLSCLYYSGIISLKNLQVTQIIHGEDIEELQKENERLRGVLENLLPKEQKVIYDTPYRDFYYYKTSFQTTSLQEVIEKGKTVRFNLLYNEPQYLRPIYDSSWKDFYFRGWTYLHYKVEEARHRLFVFPVGGSSNFDFSGSLGFGFNKNVKNIIIDAHRNINFLIYKFNVKSVKVLDRQIVLVGEPVRTGVQVVSVVQDDLLPDGVDTNDYLIQLSTPKGYEVDFIYYNIIRYEYLKKKIEENTVRSANINKDIEQLKKENTQLKEELSKYIPLEEGIITEEKCSRNFKVKTIDIKTVREKGRVLTYKINYQNKQYKRPIYHPLWKQYYQRGWGYIPKKICENLHTSFVIPNEPNKQTDFFGSLGFFDKYIPIRSSDVGFLVYNFTVEGVIKYNNQIIILGIPSRTGAEIFSINANKLKSKNDYVVQLVIPDNLELDYENLKMK